MPSFEFNNNSVSSQSSGWDGSLPATPTAQGFTLLDPELFCVDGVSTDEKGRAGHNTLIGISGAMRALSLSRTATLKTAGRFFGPIASTASAGLTTAALVKDNQSRIERQQRLSQAAQEYLDSSGCQWEEYLPDLMEDELQQRQQVASVVGATGDYISAGSGFLLMFPPVAAAGFVTGLAIKASTEVSKHAERHTLKNIYDLIAQRIVNEATTDRSAENPNAATIMLNRLDNVLQQRGLSPEGTHRLEVWALYNALLQFHPEHPSFVRDHLIQKLETQLLTSLDTLRQSKKHSEQCRREFVPVLIDGQLTISHNQIRFANSSQPILMERLQVSAFESLDTEQPADWVAKLQKRLCEELKGVSEQTNQKWTHSELNTAASRALTAALADFDAISMLTAKIAYRLYIDTAGDSSAIACVDEDAYRDCHFVACPDSIDVMRCGVFKVYSADSENSTAYIPYLRSVEIPLSEQATGMSEKFEFLSEKWYPTAQAAAQQLPNIGIPAPFVPWRNMPQAFIESQLALLAQGLEKALATGPNAENALSEFLPMEARSFIEGQNPRRAFMDLSRRTRRLSGKALPNQPTPDECLSAATLLLKASNVRATQGDKLNQYITQQDLQNAIAVRQHLLRGGREYLAHVLPESVKSGQEKGWSQTLRESFESALEGLEQEVLSLALQSMPQGLT